MRCSSLLAVALLSACGASQVQSQRLSDGTWSFRCETTMDDCVRRAQEKCPNKRFRILEGVSETRLRDAPPYEQAYHTSRLRLVCTRDGAEPVFSLGGESKPLATPAAAAAAPAASPSVCTRGQTRECVGAGACKGGQTCLADGSGFGACDCGPAPALPTTPDVPPPSSSATPMVPTAP